MTLYEHQITGADYLASRSRGYLADTPGLGKTRTAIEALVKVRARSPLVVCPAIVRTHWTREFDAMGWHGWAVVKSYDEVLRGGVALMKELLTDPLGPEALVLDEAHYLKHAGAKRTQLLLGKNGYARRMLHVYALSGTPISKNPAELWTILSSLFPEVAVKHGLKTWDDFLARFCRVEPRLVRGKWIDKIAPELRNEDEYRRIVKKIMLRRTLDDVGLDVPALDWQVVRLDKQEGASMPWELLRQELHPGVQTAIDAGTLADIADEEHIARMRRRLGELKVKPVVEMLKSQLEDTDEKIVVFAHHRNVLAGLRDGLADFGVSYIDGDTHPTRREWEISGFQKDARIRVFLGQTIACQTGITLTAARRVVLVEPDWTAVVNHQAGHRVARIGQKAERCIGQMIALADTLDEAIVAQNVRETRLAGEIERQAA